MNEYEQRFLQGIEAAETGLTQYLGEDGKMYTQDDIDLESPKKMSRSEMAQSPEIMAIDPMIGADGRPDPAYLEARANLPLEKQKEMFEREAFQAIGAPLGFSIAVLLTLPDLISIGPLIAAGMITAEEGKKFENVLNMLKYVPSAQVGEFLKDQGKNLGFSDSQVEAFGEGYLGGELSSIIVNVVPGAKKLVKGAKWLRDMTGDVPTARTPPATGTLEKVPGSKDDLQLAPGSPDAEAGQFTMTKDGEFIQSTGYVSTKPDFKKLLDSKANSETLEKHPHVENTTNEMLSRPTTEETAKQQGVWNTSEWQESRVYTTEAGEKIKGYEAATDWLVNHAKTFAWTDDGMPPPPNPVKQDKELIIIVGPPAAGKSTLANPIARTKGAMIIDADEAKRLIPGYDKGVGANVVHEESSQINKLVFRASIETGNNIVVPIVGGKAEKIVSGYIGPAKELGYRITLVDMMVDPEVALQRMYSRFINSDRLIPPEVAKVGTDPTKAFDQLVKEGAADAYTKIDNNPGKGEPRVVIRDDDNIIEASGINARRLGSSSRRSGGGDGQTRVQRDGKESSPASNGKRVRKTRPKK